MGVCDVAWRFRNRRVKSWWFDAAFSFGLCSLSPVLRRPYYFPWVACFGGGDSDRRRRKSRRWSPSRSPPRPAQVALVALEEGVGGRGCGGEGGGSGGGRGGEGGGGGGCGGEGDVAAVARCKGFDAATAGCAAHWHKPRQRAELTEQRALTPPSPTPTVKVVIGVSPDREPRELTKQKASPESSFLQEKKVTPQPSTMKHSPVAAAIVSTPDVELRSISASDSSTYVRS